ncbi:histidine kinase [Flavobacterium sp.]|jgi:hypothetical protein|uniref:sensor histidine kinase n=1 Tax=Flavobacterium sp. TaxID=239 RepID=UPI0037C17FD3
MYLKKYTLFYLFLFSLHVCGQNPFYYKIDQSKGLPSNNVYDIFQDSKGFMWFTTNLGICKFDGKNFSTFSNNIQTSRSGSNIKEDKLGRIWYSNFDGYLYYIENNQLKALNNTKTIGFVKFGLLDEFLLVLQKDAIIVYRLKDLKKIKIIKIDTKYLIATHCANNLFFLICKDLIIIDKNLKQKQIKLPKDIVENFPASILQNTPDGLLFVSKYAHHFYLLKNKKFIKKKIEGKFNFIQNLAFDGNTNWICTTQGVIKYKDNEINTKNTYFKNFNISYVFKDRHQNYWFSTISEGLLLVPSISNNFIPFNEKPNVINLYNNQLFIGTTNDKIFKTNINDFKFSNIFNGETNHEVYFLSIDSVNKLILFTSNSFKTFNLVNTKNKTEDIIALKDAQKIDQTYYAFAASGICGFLKVSKQKSNWDEFISKYQNSVNQKGNMISVINSIQGKSATYNPFNQTIYYATSSGLFAVTRKQKTEIKFNNKSLYFSKIKNFKDIIIGITTNEQLYIIDAKNRAKLFNPNHITNAEKTIKFKIIQNYLYLFTPYSIYEYDLITKKSKKIIALNPEFEITDLCKNGSKLILANTRGFLILNNQNNNHIKHPKFIINTIKVNGVPKTISDLKNLTFNQNNININFSILSFIPNQKNRLYYKINSQEWQSLDDDSRNFKLNSLSPGSYNISFQTEYENKKSPITTLKIEIEKPFWLTSTFILLIFTLCFSIVFWLYQWQIRKIKRHNQLILDKINLEKNVNQSKLKAIKSQMNPHFFYNALNTLQSYILSNEKKEAIEYLSKFSNLTRTILEMTEKDWVTIADEIKTLTLYLEIEKVRFEKDFSFSISTDSKLDIENIKIPSMLLQPFVENAVKHGLLHQSGSKILSIHFKLTNENIIVIIDDNGIGRQKSEVLNSIKNKKHQSFATHALQNRINLINQYNQNNIAIEIIDKTHPNDQPTGTKVIIKIPLNI